MKRKITLSIALVFSVAIISLLSSDVSAQQAPAQTVYVADTGVITLGPNQFLRFTTVVPQRSLVTSVVVTFNTQMNTHGTCNASLVCVHTVASRSTSLPVTMLPGQGASIDVRPAPGASGVRVEMLMRMNMSPSTRPAIEANYLVMEEGGAVVASNKLFVGGLSWDTNDEGLRE